MPADNDATRASHLASGPAKFHHLISRFVPCIRKAPASLPDSVRDQVDKGREHATMGSVSASDAPLPLPRLGEVFFDVRGSSRSMRLSWYADTGISVFSIWQGGTCTGTFRLSQEELPRLMESLQRGAHGDPRDPRGTGGFPRQLPGAPTDPRLAALPGYAGTRDFGGQDFAVPVTGDFRAVRPDEPTGAMMLGSASPRALPPPATQYRDEGYPEQAQYAAQDQYPDQAQYVPQDQYPDQAYAGPGYQERGRGARGSELDQRYDDQGYDQAYSTSGEPGYQGYGYTGPDRADAVYDGPSYPAPAYPAPSYSAPSFSGQGYDGQTYQDQGYDRGSYSGQGYDERGYQEHGYQGPAYQEQGYGSYHEQGSQSFEAHGGYQDAEGPGSVGYAPQGYQPGGYGQQGYQQDLGQSYPDHGYNEYGYAEQDYRDPGQAYQEQRYTHPADQPSSGYTSDYDGAAGYDRASYPSAGYDGHGYDAAGYPSAGYDGSGYPSAGYDGAGYDGSGYDGVGYDGSGHDGAGYDGSGYQGGSGRSDGYGQPPSGGSGDHAGYQDSDVTPNQSVSSFPYDGGPPPRREHRRRRRR
jgi:hypothetical protein